MSSLPENGIVTNRIVCGDIFRTDLLSVEFEMVKVIFSHDVSFVGIIKKRFEIGDFTRVHQYILCKYA